MIGATSGLSWIPLGQLLVQTHLIEPLQLERALAVNRATGKRLGQVVVELGLTTERAVAGALAEQYGLEYVDLDGFEPDPNAVALLTETVARRYEALPIRIGPDGLPLLAVSDPTTSRRRTTSASPSGRISRSRSRSRLSSTSRSLAPTAGRSSSSPTRATTPAPATVSRSTTSATWLRARPRSTSSTPC